MADLSPLLHMLGLDAKRRDPWRNLYVTGPDDAKMLALADAGLVYRAVTPGFCARGDVVYMATERGKSVAIAENARVNPPPSRSRARYLRWLDVSDVCPDLTFREYLMRKMYEDSYWEARRG